MDFVGSLKGLYHYSLAALGALIYGFPSKKLFVFGVTGTKGKSTVIELIDAILEAAGKKTALVSSVHIKIGADITKNSSSMTMPGRLFLQRFLRQAVKAKCDYAFIEVTSQGVLQFRHKFINFDAVMVTNIHKEHIEAHGSYKNYLAAKCRFFKDALRSSKKPKYFFINEAMRDRECFEVVEDIKYFSRENFIHNELAQRYALSSEEAKKLVSSWLQNDFNLENVAAAVAFAKSQNISWDVIFKTLENFRGVPGRMDIVQKSPFFVVVDYAHTPDSLEAVYKSFEVSPEKLIAVLGAAGGGRDKWKREAMGHLAAKYANRIILTNEDPYDESPEEILNNLEKGISEDLLNRPVVERILDRRLAIAKAISYAVPGDVVIITGKGSEPWMHLANGIKIPWSDKKIVEEAIDNNKVNVDYGNLKV